MSRKLKVYGVNYDGRTRRIVAATSRAAAARLIGVKPGCMAQCGGETWNEKEIELAMREIGKVWSRAHSRGGKWEPLGNDPAVDLPRLVRLRQKAITILELAKPVGSTEDQALKTLLELVDDV